MGNISFRHQTYKLAVCIVYNEAADIVQHHFIGGFLDGTIWANNNNFCRMADNPIHSGFLLSGKNVLPDNLTFFVVLGPVRSSNAHVSAWSIRHFTWLLYCVIKGSFGILP
jgi:hypothetical protein